MLLTKNDLESFLSYQAGRCKWLILANLLYLEMIMFLIMVLVLMIFISGQRFVLSEPVVDKETKMRQTLRIMSMRSSVYGLSYFITQAI